MIFASSVSKDFCEVQITEKALKTPADLLGDGPGEPCSGDPRSLRGPSSPAGGPGSRKGRTRRGLLWAEVAQRKHGGGSFASPERKPAAATVAPGSQYASRTAIRIQRQLEPKWASTPRLGQP